MEPTKSWTSSPIFTVAVSTRRRCPTSIGLREVPRTVRTPSGWLSTMRVSVRTSSRSKSRLASASSLMFRAYLVVLALSDSIGRARGRHAHHRGERRLRAVRVPGLRRARLGARARRSRRPASTRRAPVVRVQHGHGPPHDRSRALRPARARHAGHGRGDPRRRAHGLLEGRA